MHIFIVSDYKCAELRSIVVEDVKKCWCKSGKDYDKCHQSLDSKLAKLRKQGKQIPTHKMIKNEKQIEGIRKAGEINSKVLDKVAKTIRAGMTTADIDKIVYDETIRLGATPACLGYEGFPKSVCTSVNDVVCHGIPSEKLVLKTGDIVNVDCTTIVNGYYGDSSRMFEIGKVSDEVHKLVTTAKECLDKAVNEIKPYCHVGDIGYIISKHAKENGYSVVKELGGHGVGLEMHEDPFVDHTAEKGTGMLLVPGMVFTIEPMINAGDSEICIDDEDGWTIYTWDGNYSAQWEYTLLMTETGVEILAR